MTATRFTVTFAFTVPDEFDGLERATARTQITGLLDGIAAAFDGHRLTGTTLIDIHTEGNTP